MRTSATKVFILVDCNNFFVSCEQLFRPDTALKPVVVLSSNDSCVISRSKEAKDLGIPMGVPLFQVRDTLTENNVVVFSSNRPLYRDISRRVMALLREYSDSVEEYSIDEAFLLLPEASAVQVGERIRSDIQKKVGLAVSVGIGPTKTLAKFANSIAKRTHTVCVRRGTEPDVLSASLRTVWGVGVHTADALQDAHINTVADLRAQTSYRMKKLLGVYGERLFNECSGVTHPHPHAAHELQKSFMSTHSLPQATAQYTVLCGALTYHIQHVAHELRKLKMVARKCTVILRTRNMSGRETGRIPCIVEVPTSDTLSLIHSGIAGLKNAFVGDRRYVSIGVVLHDLIPAAFQETSLFEDKDKNHTDTLMATLDALVLRYGENALYIGTLGQKDIWKSKSSYKSPCYTTSWKEIRDVHIL